MNFRIQTYLKSVFPVLLISSVFFYSCDQQNKKIELAALNESQDVLVHITTEYGKMTAILYDKTPLHKQNFLNLANSGAYNDLLFHRVIERFMIQGGDPESKEASKEAILGRGEMGEPIKAEINPDLFHKKGVLSAARKNDKVNPEKKSNGSQFFIVQGKKFTEKELTESLVDYRRLYVYFDSAMRNEYFSNMQQRFAALQVEGNRDDISKFILNAKEDIEQHYQVELDGIMPEKHREVYTTIGGYPSLDGAYTVFGEVIQGLEVIDKIAALPTGKGDRPTEDVVMQVSLEVASRDKIIGDYGYQYE